MEKTINKDELQLLDKFANTAMNAIVTAKFEFMNTHVHDPIKEITDLIENIGDSCYAIAGMMLLSRKKFIKEYAEASIG